MVCLAMKMREKEIVNYIYFSYSEAGKNKVIFRMEDMAEIPMLNICICKKQRQRKKEGKCKAAETAAWGTEQYLSKSMVKKIKKEIKKYQTEGCVLGADEKLAGQIELTDVLFRARKQELLRQKEYIFAQLKFSKEGGRSSMLLVINSRKWDFKEIMLLLLTAKNYYEDIYVKLEEDSVEIKQIADYLYEEWGVMLHIQSWEMMAEVKEYDFVLFLLREWKKDIVRKYVFCKAYIVMETEKGVVRNEEKVFRDNNRCLYSGLMYERENKHLPYQMAVNIACQNPALYKGFAVSFIAIYRLEC